MAKKRDTDTRRILSGVQLPIDPKGRKTAGPQMRTYYQQGNPGEPGHRDDRDDLEDVMTPAQMEYLKEQGAIEGDWEPGGAEDLTVRHAPSQQKRGQSAKNYAELHVDELHAEASRRNIEGRSELKTHDQLVKALEKHDRDAAKKS
jgi:hypothetical protein